MAESGVFWDALLQLIAEGRVVPVVGQDLSVVQTPEGPALLYAYLARRLAEYLGISGENLADGTEINDVACRHLAQGNSIEDIYPALIKVASDAAALPIPEPLRQLAEIGPLNTFVTTTFDSMLLHALNESRFGGQPKTLQLAYAPSEIEDLPPDFKALTVPVVYHLFGKLSATPTFAATHEDIIEFFHALQSDTRCPNLLFDELNRQSLLVLGSRFGGWLTRFLMRMAKRQRLSAGGKSDYIASADLAGDKDLVLFLKSFSRSTKLYSSGGAVQFVAELHRRWKEKEPNRPAMDRGVQPGATAAPIEPGAVFLSYASGDLEVVERIKSALEKARVDVFLDTEQLQPGDAWAVKLQMYIEKCSLFVPIISRRTLTPDRRYFRKEWNLALEEAEKVSFSPEAAFLLPVIIDDTPINHPDLPARFASVQSEKLPGGEPTEQFVTRVRDLYRAYQKAKATAA